MPHQVWGFLLSVKNEVNNLENRIKNIQTIEKNNSIITSA